MNIDTNIPVQRERIYPFIKEYFITLLILQTKYMNIPSIKNKYQDFYSDTDSCKMAIEILCNTLDKKDFNIVNEVVNNNLIYFNHKSNNSFCIDDDGRKIFFGLENNIEDIFCYVHELTHTTHYKEDWISFLLAESASIFTEYVVADELRKNTISNNNDVDLFMIKRYYDLKRNHIDCLESLNTSFGIDYERNTLFQSMTYLLSTVFSTRMYNLYKENKQIGINCFSRYNEMIRKSDFNGAMESIGLNILYDDNKLSYDINELDGLLDDFYRYHIQMYQNLNSSKKRVKNRK